MQGLQVGDGLGSKYKNHRTDPARMLILTTTFRHLDNLVGYQFASHRVFSRHYTRHCLVHERIQKKKTKNKKTKNDNNSPIDLYICIIYQCIYYNIV